MFWLCHEFTLTFTHLYNTRGATYASTSVKHRATSVIKECGNSDCIVHLSRTVPEVVKGPFRE